ncbi:MAG: tetratricopeptide repeat protein [Myxococcaceae bacterium]|jgi:tetratricopeptide (TPR) repeat protein|nr:tetratricopeptide repeat protein [Myxococcaceae bacterium]
MKQTFSFAEVVPLVGGNPASAQVLVELVWGSAPERFTFQDLVLLRTAKGLLERRVSRLRVRQALAEVRARLDGGLPLSSVAVQQEGAELVAKVGASRWNAETGQALLDLQPTARATGCLEAPAQRDADALFARAVAEEQEAPAAALASYREALGANPMHADAHVNLGRLLHQRGHLREAEAHYVAALVARPEDATATFNLAVVLDDQGRLDEAIARYQEALRLDPSCLDAYFNLARVYEKKGERIAALRHLKDYRRLSHPR